MNKKKEKRVIYTTPCPGRVIPCLSTLAPSYRKTALVQPWSWVLGAVRVFTPQDALIALGDQPERSPLCSSCPLRRIQHWQNKWKKKENSEVGPFLSRTYCTSQTKETLRKLLRTSQRKQLHQQFFWQLFCFEVAQPRKYAFCGILLKSFSTSLWLSCCNWEFQLKLGVTRSTLVQEGKPVPGKGMTQKGNEIMYSDPGASCPKSVTELLKIGMASRPL